MKHLLFHYLLLLASILIVRGQQPNIVFIISDDAGFADWTFMDPYASSINPGQNPSPVPTPNLTALRSRGVLFTNAYTAAVCSPSRAAIMTGSYQQRIGYEYNINNLTDPNGNLEGLRSEDITIFERMKARGYTTGGIGKWHVGGIPDIITNGTVTQPGNRPPRQGVDEFFGILRGSRNYDVGPLAGDETRALREMSLDSSGLEVNNDIEADHNGEYVTNTFGQGAIDFIDRHYADAAPFFLYVSFTAPHSPIGPSPDRNAAGISSDYGSDFSANHTASLTKRGTSILTMSGTHTFSGELRVENGALVLDDADFNDASKLSIESVLSGSGSISGDADILGEFVVTEDDQLIISGELDITSGTLTVVGSPTSPKIIATYGTRIGTFSTANIPAGYGVDYNHNGNQIALVSPAPYTHWAETTSGLSGADAAFDSDPNQDGIANGIAFFLGAANASEDANSRLPRISVEGESAVFSFTRNVAAEEHAFLIRYSTDLTNWSTVASSITTVGQEITATVPLSLAVDGKLFLDLVISK